MTIRQSRKTLLARAVRAVLARAVAAGVGGPAHDTGRPMAVWSRDHIGLRIMLEGLYERDELEAVSALLGTRMPQLAEGVFIDCGANIGNHTVFFAPMFRKVVAIEAGQRNFSLLQVNTAAYPNVVCVQKGVGEAPGTLELAYAPGNYGASRLVAPAPRTTIAGAAATEAAAGAASGVTAGADPAREEVTVAPLDDLFDEPLPLTMLKIDVEGMELAVISGARQLIKRHQPVILLELLENSFQGTKNPTIEALQELGYRRFWYLEKSWHSNRGIGSKIARYLASFMAGPRLEWRPFEACQRAADYNMVIAVPDRFCD